MFKKAFFVMAITPWPDICDGHHRCAPTGAPIVKMQETKNSRLKFRAVHGERNMCNQSWIYALPLAILFALQATPAHTQEAIGKATSVVPQATGSHAGPLSGGSNVYSKETIRTGQSGQADLQFKDNSNLKVGSNSSVHLDKFVYDPNKSTSAVAIQATRGTFRFVAGSQGNGSVQIKTPYGTLGVRG
jgi:FecR protein